VSNVCVCVCVKDHECVCVCFGVNSETFDYMLYSVKISMSVREAMFSWTCEIHFNSYKIYALRFKFGLE
jgi:hypothetical protein